MSGSILSHDFVEAALMRRAGFHVWLVADLVGSYEQQPPDLLAELQRDRRWCQGNLQNARLIAEPGLHAVHRSMFATGAMAYLSAPLWLCFMTLGTVLWLTGSPMVTDWTLLPSELMALWAWTLSMLFLPRILGLAAVVINGQQAAYGGTASLLRSAGLETLIALLQAPIRMLAHSLFVVVALTGLKLEWKSPPREAAAVPWVFALRQLAPMSLIMPLLLSIPMTVVTSRVGLGEFMRAQRYLLIPEETKSPAVLKRAWLHASMRARPALLAA